MRLEETFGLEQRTPEWIRENGYCLEHLIPGPSQIEHAGQGAIAQFAINEGGVVVPAPSLHILDKQVLERHDHHHDDEEEPFYQLLLNYCLGHASTTLLVCPLTNAILINHCSERQPQLCPPGVTSPNAKLEWSDSSEEWLNMTLDDMHDQPSGMRGLSLNVIALCDIAVGEEVVMDYGIEWEQAWIEHVFTAKGCC